MTIQPAESPGTLSIWQGETGLEDFSSSDVSMPRLVIDHADGCFRDTQTEETFASVDAVLFGLHKGRIMWGDISDGDDSDPPLCKSPDHKHGFPNMDPELSKTKQFPWNAQDVFSPDDAQPLEIEDVQTLPSLPCEKCHFKKWNTDPTGKRPWCAEVWTFPLAYKNEGADGEELWVPALFSVKRSGLKPAKNYVTPFATRKVPIFTVVTRLSLQMQKRGSVKFGVPVFTKTAPTDRDDWPMYRDQFLSAYAFLSQFPLPRTPEEGDSDVIEGNEVEYPEAQSQPEPQPEPEPEPEPEPQPEPEPKAVSISGKIKPRGPQAPAGPSAPAPSSGTMQIDDDEEPPF